MNKTFLKYLLTSTCVLALSAVVSFAEEPAKKDGDKKCPCPDAPAPKAAIDFNSDDCPKKCDKDKKDAPVVAPATAEEAPAKKDGDKKCPCPDAPAPKV